MSCAAPDAGVVAGSRTVTGSLPHSRFVHFAGCYANACAEGEPLWPGHFVPEDE
jgi:hypothetical protein